MAISGGDGSIILTTKVDDSGLKKGLSSMRGFVSKVGKSFAVIGAAAGAATVAITKMAVSAYADYEQLVGGVETLFKGSAQKVIDYANDAFYTAGVSANEYMQQVTSFSASLIRSTAGDTNKAADIANMALIDISDNVNKMGSSMESVTLAYQGFAKQQYMLLDNLKLGYGGTKTEMERLLRDAEALTGVKYDINNLADVYSAIHAIQEELGITGTTAKEAEKTITGSANMMKAAWQNVLSAVAGGGDLDRAINNLVYSIQKYFENIVPVVQRSLIGIGQLIERVGPLLVQNVASALIQAIPSLVSAVFNMIVGLAKGIWAGIKALFSGGSGSVTAEIKSSVGGVSSSVGGLSSSLDDATSGMDALGNATEKAGKKAKRYLAAFDEVNKIPADDGGGAGGAGSGIGIPGISAGGIGGDIGGSVGSGVLSGIVDDIKKDLEYLLPTIELALVAIGLILLAMGNIPWGIGFIVAGAYLYSVTKRSKGKFDFNVVKKDLKNLADWIEEILVAIGIILMFLGQIPWGIGFIIAGAAIYAVKEISTSEYNTSDVTTKLAVIMEAVSISLIGIGIMLIFFGHIPLGFGFIVVGKGLLGIQEQKLQDSGVTTKIQKFMEENQALIVGVALALLVVGIMLFAFGQVTPLALGLVVAGATVLATEEKINSGAIKKEVSRFFQENAGLIVGVSLALVVLGVILLFSGVGIPLGLGLLLAGGVALASTVTANWGFIVDKIREVWSNVKNFWNSYIAPVFTAEWWLKLAKKCGNGLIGGFEGAINGIITMFEKMINWIVNGLNKIRIEIPDWVPGLGGKSFGFDIPEASFGRVSIPRLAQGAVIPPNREFLAVLGDQKHGTNIEAPLDTIKQAVSEVVNNNGGTGMIELTVLLDGDIIYKKVVQKNRDNTIRTGRNALAY